MAPHVIIVGSDKGGVGKTMVSRVLMDYLKSKSIESRAFDSEAPLGVLKRFAPDKTEIVDLTKSDDQMRVFDTLKGAQVTLIDVRAGLLSATLKMLSEIGFLEGAKENKFKVTVLHVIGSTHASFEEITSTADLIKGSRHFLVVNHINEGTFLGLSDDLKKIGGGVIDVPKLNELAADHVDAAGVLFEPFVANQDNSYVMRGYVKSWEAKVFQAFDAAELT